MATGNMEDRRFLGHGFLCSHVFSCTQCGIKM